MSESVLSLWLIFSGQQGGTIHDSVADFRKLPESRQDAFCGNLTNHLSNLSDPQNATLFMRARMESRGIVIRTAGGKS